MLSTCLTAGYRPGEPVLKDFKLDLRPGIATLEVVLHLLRMQRLLGQNTMYGRLSRLGQGRIARFHGMPAHV